MIDSSINPFIDRIAVRLKTIPESPGVYQHLDASGKVIYVGKARNLQRRVASYFTHYDDKSAKIRMLVRNIRDIRVTVVASEVDALLLENTLIKQYKPRYNSLLKDDKTYPWLCLTDEFYPRLILTRNHKTPGQYFGPYPNRRVLRQLQEIVSRLFPIRSCRQAMTGESAKASRACLKQQLGLCKAPCVGFQSHDEYMADIAGIRRLLGGDFADILRDLQGQMLSLARELRFEEADAVKRKIRLLEEYQSRSTVVGTNIRDIDVYTLESDGQTAYVNMMRIKEGAIIQSFSNEVRKRLDESDAEILATVIPALHEQTGSTATEAIASIAVPGVPDEYLRLTVPTRGDRLKLLELSLRNVKAYRLQCRHQQDLLSGGGGHEAHNRRQIERIGQILGLPAPPREIECFDISNISGAYPVAAMVRFSNGSPNRKEYRKYNIKTVEGPDDYASMAEVVRRRYRRLADEGKPLPDLIIVDGGRGQMEAARRTVRDELNLAIPIAGLAKDDRHRTSEVLVFPSTSSGQDIRVVGLKPSDPLFHLLEQIQDEVHRFAITFHRDKRSKGTFRTTLTDIPGIGEKTARKLLLHFGSVKEINNHTEADIAAIVGPAKAKLITNH